MAPGFIIYRDALRQIILFVGKNLYINQMIKDNKGCLPGQNIFLIA